MQRNTLTFLQNTVRRIMKGLTRNLQAPKRLRKFGPNFIVGLITLLVISGCLLWFSLNSDEEYTIPKITIDSSNLTSGQLTPYSEGNQKFSNDPSTWPQGVNMFPIKILSWTNENMKTKEEGENWFPDNFRQCRPYLEPWMDCQYTFDKSQIKKSEVIIFRGRKIDVNNMPNYRSPQQKWMFYEFEPPYKVWEYVNLTLVSNQFNLTSTYSRDSDLFKNGFLRKCVYDSAKSKWIERKFSNENFAASKGEGKLVAWFVSICNTQSQRERYVKELQSYINVDIYGDCGPLKCGSAETKTWKSDQCEKTLLHDPGSYKFYLAFENSLCQDYISEKLWKIHKMKVVPVVMGAAEYSIMRPPDSYIDITDFSSPKELADYLYYLDQNDEAYNRYIINDQALLCRQMESKIPWHCRLCRYLHENRDRQQQVHDLAQFWGMKKCRRPSEFLHKTGNGNFSIY